MSPRVEAKLRAEVKHLRAVHRAAARLVEAVHSGDEGCVCGVEMRRFPDVHAKGCPVFPRTK